MKKKLTPAQLKARAEANEKRAFSRKIQNAFKNAGFQYLPTRDKEVEFNGQRGDFDEVFLYENVLVICEETTTQEKDIKDHLKKKKIFYDEVDKCKKEVLEQLKSDHAEKFKLFKTYDDSRYFIFYLYFTKNKFNPTEEVIKQFLPIKIVEYGSLNYLFELSQSIKLSARSEIFRFLDLKSRDVGTNDPSRPQATIDTNIIYPQDNTGMKNGVRLVSFMMSAEKLITNSFVLRKDNWEKIELYQRLIKKSRIQNIRKHLAAKERAFVNNIIVSLPPGVSFINSKGEQVKIEDIKNYGESFTMSFIDEFNTICIIDGQHRVFAHYEGGPSEEHIAPLRQKLHLLVTGLIFPPEMPEHERLKFESEIFLDINSNARPVPPDVILFIQTLQDPFSGVGIARKVLEKLNQQAPFHNLLQMSSMEVSRIKIASIIKFALKGLVEISDDGRQDSFYYHWAKTTGKELVNVKDPEVLKEYIDFITTSLSIYFNAFKSNYSQEEWDDKESKILSTTSINGFIIAYRRLLVHSEIKDFKFYSASLKKLTISFSKDKFPYASSQYSMFSKVILEECFGIVE
jgi:DGQHR domain-containing protein